MNERTIEELKDDLDVMVEYRDELSKILANANKGPKDEFKAEILELEKVPHAPKALSIISRHYLHFLRYIMANTNVLDQLQEQIENMSINISHIEEQ